MSLRIHQKVDGFKNFANQKSAHQMSQKLTHQQGMTLFEILVVMAIIGLVFSVASPPMFKVLESVAFKATSDEITQEISAMRVAALLEQKTIHLVDRVKISQSEDAFSKNHQNTLDLNTPIFLDAVPDQVNNPKVRDVQLLLANGDGQPTITLPDDWTIEGDDIVFLKTGICLGGSVIVKAPSGRAKTLRFKAPDCQIINEKVR